MQTIQGLLLGVCFAGVLGGIVHLLSPGGSTDRMLRLIVTLFILASIAVPLRSVVRKTVSDTVQMQTDAAVDAVLQNAETAIRQTAQRVLETHSCTGTQIIVKTDGKEGEVHATEFVIRGVPAEKAQEIAHEIFSLTGEMPRMETRAQKSGGE